MIFLQGCKQILVNCTNNSSSKDIFCPPSYIFNKGDNDNNSDFSSCIMAHVDCLDDFHCLSLTLFSVLFAAVGLGG